MDRDVDYFSTPQYGIDGSSSAVLLSRNCDYTDAACDICAGFDDAIDTDADSIPDGCDICTNPTRSLDMTKAKATVRQVVRGHCAKTCKANRVRAVGRFTVAQAIETLTPKRPASQFSSKH